MEKTISILTIIGARPQFVKAAVVSRALSTFGIAEDLLHTGQHFDHNMDAVFFEELEIPKPKVNLQAGGDSQSKQTAKMMVGIEGYLMSAGKHYDAILVYGDTNSTLAAALVAAKMHIPIFHVEAGLRSNNRSMPEEINRIITDQLSALLFCPSQDAAKNLQAEGISNGVEVVGDVMQDAFQFYKNKRVNLPQPLEELLNGDFGLLTLHRPSNTDDENKIQSIFNGIEAVNFPVIWPVHPRLKNRLHELTLPKNIIPISPLTYLQMLKVLNAVKVVFTDSGGLQKETYWSGKKCITLREETEWIETVKEGWNHLVGASESKIILAVQQPLPSAHPALYGNGTAGEKIAVEIKKFFAVNRAEY